MKSIIWKTESGRKLLEQQYDKFLSMIDSEVQIQTIETRLGSGQMLVAGPAKAPPIICLHAMRTGASYLLSELQGLAKVARLYVPDLPGQSVKGIDAKFSLKDDSNADWLAEVMDSQNLNAAAVFGVSWGGWVARQFANVYPHRVERLGLLVPAGIFNGSHFTSLSKMLWPLIRYKFSSTRENLKKLLTPILSTFDDHWLDFFEVALAHWKIDQRIPPLATDEQLQLLKMPVSVIAAEKDISFPGVPLIERIKQHVPHAKTELIAGCKHCPPSTDEFRYWLAKQLVEFFV